SNCGKVSATSGSAYSFCAGADIDSDFWGRSGLPLVLNGGGTPQLSLIIMRLTLGGDVPKLFVKGYAAVALGSHDWCVTAGGNAPRRATLEVIQRAFELAGVELINENSGTGVVLRKR